jgi:hypothetical protein
MWPGSSPEMLYVLSLPAGTMAAKQQHRPHCRMMLALKAWVLWWQQHLMWQQVRLFRPQAFRHK